MTPPIEQSTVDRMVALVHRLVERGAPHYDFPETLEEAHAIAALLPAPVDPDLEEARRLIGIVNNGLIGGRQTVSMVAAALRKAREEGAK